MSRARFGVSLCVSLTTSMRPRRRCHLLPGAARFAVPPGAVISLVTPLFECPSCGALGTRHHHEGHLAERECPECRLTWEPRESYILVELS